MENYIMLEGKKIPLTDEQIEMLRDSKKPEEAKKSPFERQLHCGDKYYAISERGIASEYTEVGNVYNRAHFAIANYCTDKQIMTQRALHEILNRLLWRFSMENGGENPWGVYTSDGNYYITYDYDTRNPRFTVVFTWLYKINGTVYFSSEELAQQAIEEIVKPFMKKHPEFVW